MELQKQLMNEKKTVSSLMSEVRELKHRNIEEIHKNDQAHFRKYSQLKELVGEHKTKVTELELLAKRGQAAFVKPIKMMKQELLASNLELSHPDTERVRAMKDQERRQ
jgi:hypothetical protein